MAPTFRRDRDVYEKLPDFGGDSTPMMPKPIMVEEDTDPMLSEEDEAYLRQMEEEELRDMEYAENYNMYPEFYVP